MSTFVGNQVGLADGVGTSAQFSNISDIAIHPDGYLVVADSINNRIRAVAVDGNLFIFNCLLYIEW